MRSLMVAPWVLETRWAALEVAWDRIGG
jgi:hypothetical protein